MILHYLKVAWRNLLKYKVHHLISVLCLAIGIVCYSLADYFIGRSDYYSSLPDAERRIILRLSSKEQPYDAGFTVEDISRMEEWSVDGLTALSVESYSRSTEVSVIDHEQQESPFIIEYTAVNPYSFRYEGRKLLYGDRLPEHPDEVVLSRRFARKVFGTENPIGSIVCPLEPSIFRDNGIRQFKIVNVVEEGRLTEQEIDCYFSYQLVPDHTLGVKSLLAEGVTLASLNSNLQKQSLMHKDGAWTASAISVMHQYDQMRVVRLMFRLLASLILISALINFLKFVFQMFYNRHREVALRKCMGSDTKGLLTLLFAEIFWMLSAALLLSLAGMEICVSVAAQYIAEWPDLNWIELYGTQIKNYLLLLLLCLPMAYVPVWRLRRTSISSQITGRNERHVFRSMMMWLQLSIAVFFVGSVLYIQIVLHRTFDSYSPFSPEEEEQIIVFQPNSFYVRKNLEPMLNDFMALPEIIGKISTVQYPQTLYSIDWQNGKRNRKVEYVTGSPDYFDFLHIPLQGEKWVADVGDVVYVSERLNGALAKDSVPYSITLEGKPYRIAGVYKALYGESKDTVRMAGSVFFPSREYNYLYFRVAAGQDAQKVMDRLEKIYRTYIPETLPLEMRLLSDNKHTLNGSVAAIRVALVTLAFISLLLVILSIYSAISLDTTGRQKEVAIRKINGATPKAIAYLFGKSYFLIFMLAFLTGFPLACLLVNELSESGAPTIPAWQWGTLLFVFILSVVVLTVACKIRQVMQVNPAEVIKRE